MRIEDDTITEDKIVTPADGGTASKKVQVELSRYNLYRGRIDGLLGPKTKEGIIRYQMAIGLPATGELDQTTLLVMGIR